MNLCSDGHEEIAYEGRKCPVCELMKEHAKQIEALDDRIIALAQERDELKDERDQVLKDIETAMQVEQKQSHENHPAKAE